MKKKESNISFEDAMNVSNIDEVILKRRTNNMLLSDYQISILRINGFNYEKYSNIRELLFDIEDYLITDYNDELDLVASQLSDFIYYS